MPQSIAVRAPFVLDQTLAFLRRFTPCQADYVIDDDGFTAALAIDGRAVAFRVTRGDATTLRVEHPDDVGADGAAVIARRAAQLVSADDDLTGFYDAAATDAPRFRAIVDALHGLHHVRFLTLEDIAVYAVVMQRTPIAQAGRARRRFLDRFGLAVQVGDHTLRAMPAFATLVGLDVADWTAGINHPRKAAVLPGVVRGVAALGETFLRTAPYPDARAALTSIPGLGPFSAAAILLRGLGRMDDLPIAHRGFAAPARAVYGATWDPRATVRRYGPTLGYWSYYLKTGEARGLHQRIFA